MIMDSSGHLIVTIKVIWIVYNVFKNLFQHVKINFETNIILEYGNPIIYVE